MMTTQPTSANTARGFGRAGGPPSGWGRGGERHRTGPRRPRRGLLLHRPGLGLIVVAAVASLVWAAPVWAAWGELIVLEGKVKLIRGRETIVVSDRLEIEAGDRIITVPGSKAQVRFGDQLEGSEAIIAENTDIRVFDLAPSSPRSPFELIVGAVRSRLLKFLSPKPFLKSPTAVIGVKGTDFIVYVKRREATEFIGIEGLIEASSRSQPEYALEIGKRQWGEIVTGEKPRPPIRAPEEIWIAAQKVFHFPGEQGF